MGLFSCNLTAVHVHCLTTMASFFATLATATTWAVILGTAGGHCLKQLQINSIRSIVTQHHCNTTWSAAEAKQLQAICDDTN